ncbi:hypothetical protein H0H93_000504 [Arthromyces matolae]|nr:hypothetical protein H0H93_000504 [Arthromyces matolae]
MKKTFQLIVGVFVLAQFLPLVTTTPIPPSHSPGLTAIAKGSTGHLESSSTALKPGDNAIGVTDETSLDTQNKWKQPSYGYIHIPPRISVLAKIPESPKLRIGVPLSTNKDGVKSFNDILFMLRYLIPKDEKLSTWISHTRRDIGKEDRGFIVEAKDFMPPISCTPGDFARAVEEHNNHFAVNPKEWDEERARHKVKAPLVPSYPNAPIAGSTEMSGVGIDKSGALTLSSDRIVTDKRSLLVIPQPWSQPSYFYVSIPEKLMGLLKLGPEESTTLRIGVPLSEHQDAVKSFNDILSMILNLVPKNDRKYVTDWISQKRREITNKDPTFVVEAVRRRLESNCTIQDLLNAIQKHNGQFAIPEAEWSKQAIPSKRPDPAPGPRLNPQPQVPQPRNPYDQNMLAKFMPAPQNMEP